MNQNFLLWLVYCGSYDSLVYWVSCKIFFDHIVGELNIHVYTHIENLTYFFIKLIQTPSNLSGVQTFCAITQANKHADCLRKPVNMLQRSGK